MQSEFWHERWASGRIGFHLDSVNPLLIKGWSELNAAGEGRVLVPLCGKSLDMLWLREQGHEVTGVELSGRACSAFFSEQGVEVQEQQEGDFTVRRMAGLDLYCGDFFSLPQEQFDNVSWVYDRAALVAFPPLMRKQYAETLAAKLPINVAMLLVTLEFDGIKGPPFSVSEQEVHALYSESFTIARLFSKTGSGKGGRDETEVVYVLRKKG